MENLSTLLSMITTRMGDPPSLDREVRTELGGGTRACHTSAERNWPDAEVDSNFIQITQKPVRMQDTAALLRVHWGTPTQMPDYAVGPVISSLPSWSLPLRSLAR